MRYKIVLLLLFTPLLIHASVLKLWYYQQASVRNPNQGKGQRLLQEENRAILTFKTPFAEWGRISIKLEGEYVPVSFYDTNEYENIRIKEMFADIIGGIVNLRLGKQFIRWGDGAFFNPIDVVNLKRDPLKPQNENEGRNFIELDIPAGDMLSFSLISVPDSLASSNIDVLPLITKAALSINHIDAFLFARVKKGQKPVYGGTLSFTSSVGRYFSLKLNSELLWKFESDAQDWVKSGSVYLPQKRNDSDYKSWSLGLNLSYAFTRLWWINNANFSFQYYHNDENMNRESFTNFLNAQIKGFEYPFFVNSREYLYFQIALQGFLFNDLDLSCAAVLNKEDQSGFYMPSLSYKVNDDISVGTKVFILSGNDRSEFASYPYWTEGRFYLNYYY